jgi:hypothetical protein
VGLFLLGDIVVFDETIIRTQRNSGIKVRVRKESEEE